MKWTTRGWSGQGHNTKGIQRRMIFRYFLQKVNY
uniref:Uncharacterized protein n=2 Tax=Oryza TaxID=4527 RepID=A0A0E0M549_ORYPU